MHSLLNPYIAGAPIVEPSMFFGRQDVFQWIERNLSGKFVDHILVIHGQRRVGKTSVLKQIPNFLPKTYIQVFFDLQGRTSTTLERFLWWMAREVARVLRQSQGLAVSVPEQEAFGGDGDYLVAQFLPGLQPILGEHKLLLTFDEYEDPAQPGCYRPLSKSLESWINREIAAGEESEETPDSVETWLKSGGKEVVEPVKGALPRFKKKYWPIISTVLQEMSFELAGAATFEFLLKALI